MKKKWQQLSKTHGTVEYIQQRNRESDINAIRKGQYRADLREYLKFKMAGSTNAKKRRDFVLEFQNTYNTMYGITPITTIETSVNTEEQFEENVVAGRITGATSGGTAIGSWLGKAIRKFF